MRSFSLLTQPRMRMARPGLRRSWNQHFRESPHSSTHPLPRFRSQHCLFEEKIELQDVDRLLKHVCNSLSMPNRVDKLRNVRTETDDEKRGVPVSLISLRGPELVRTLACWLMNGFCWLLPSSLNNALRGSNTSELALLVLGQSWSCRAIYTPINLSFIDCGRPPTLWCVLMV